jgi:hypothetical protein
MPELEDLLFDPIEVNRRLLAGLLLPYASIQRNDGKVVFKDQWYALNIKKKILVHLASRKAATILGLLDEEAEPQFPNEIESYTEIKGNSLRPALKELMEERLLEQSSDGRYFIPGIKIHTVATQVFKME